MTNTERLAKLDELLGHNPFRFDDQNQPKDGETCREYFERREHELLAPLGITKEQLEVLIVPLFHEGPGGCDGVDTAEAYREIICLLVWVANRTRKQAADQVRQLTESLKGKALYHPEHSLQPLADDIEKGAP